MSTEPESTIPAPPIPVCPHCGADLRAINGFPLHARIVYGAFRGVLGMPGIVAHANLSESIAG
jgi:hypothetical protein